LGLSCCFEEILMSMDLHVCWVGELAWDKQKLKESLAASGLDANILHDLVDAKGFWPVDVDGFRSGVEVYFESDLDELRENYPILGAVLGARDKGVTFVFHGDAAEGGVACALAAALGRLGDAIIYEPSAGEVWSSDRAAEEARQMFESARKEGYHERPTGEEQE
jgi:hypothetical protein